MKRTGFVLLFVLLSIVLISSTRIPADVTATGDSTNDESGKLFGIFELAGFPMPWHLADTDSYDAEFWDMDGDGDYDVVIAVDGIGTYSNMLYMLVNQGNSTFTLDMDNMIPAPSANYHSVDLGDMDDDGDMDIATGVYGGQSRLFRNEGDGTFTDVTDTHMPLGSYQTWDIEFGDVDGDGDLDLFLANFGTKTSVSNCEYYTA